MYIPSANIGTSVVCSTIKIRQLLQMGYIIDKSYYYYIYNKRSIFNLPL